MTLATGTPEVGDLALDDEEFDHRSREVSLAVQFSEYGTTGVRIHVDGPGR